MASFREACQLDISSKSRHKNRMAVKSQDNLNSLGKWIYFHKIWSQ